MQTNDDVVTWHTYILIQFFFTAPGPPYFSFRPIVVNPINYHYGDDVNITCAVDFYPHPSDTLGWNFMVSYLEKIMLCI